MKNTCSENCALNKHYRKVMMRLSVCICSTITSLCVFFATIAVEDKRFHDALFMYILTLSFLAIGFANGICSLYYYVVGRIHPEDIWSVNSNIIENMIYYDDEWGDIKYENNPWDFDDEASQPKRTRKTKSIKPRATGNGSESGYDADDEYASGKKNTEPRDIKIDMECLSCNRHCDGFCSGNREIPSPPFLDFPESPPSPTFDPASKVETVSEDDYVKIV